MRTSASDTVKGDTERHRVIRDSAAALFAKKGIARTSVREIADSVGILSGSLYHHFASKDQLVSEIIENYLGEILGRLRQAADRDSDPRAALENLISASLSIICEFPEATQIYQTEGNYIRGLPASVRFYEDVAQIRQLWIDVLERGAASGAFRSNIKPLLAHRLIRDALWFTVRWFRPTADVRTEDLVAECIGLFVDGIAQH